MWFNDVVHEAAFVSFGLGGVVVFPYAVGNEL